MMSCPRPGPVYNGQIDPPPFVVCIALIANSHQKEMYESWKLYSYSLKFTCLKEVLAWLGSKTCSYKQ